MLNCIRVSARILSSIVSKSSFNSYHNNGNVSNLLSIASRTICFNSQSYSSYGSFSFKPPSSSPLLSVVNPFTPQPSRNIIKFSLKKGKRKSCKEVLMRFYRLDWGVWIRTKCGRSKKLYKKSANRKRRLRQHVFTNSSQSWLLDKMVTSYWRRPRFYVDDPYEPYHSREEFPLTRRKPFVPIDER